MYIIITAFLYWIVASPIRATPSNFWLGVLDGLMIPINFLANFFIDKGVVFFDHAAASNYQIGFVIGCILLLAILVSDDD